MPKLSIIIDLAVVAIGLGAIYRGYRNGLINQIVWLLSFLVAYLVGSRLAGTLADLLDAVIPSPAVAVGVSFVILVLATIIVLRMISRKITIALKPSVIGMVNSILGAVLNGLVFIAIVLIILNVAVLIIPGADAWIRETVVLERLTALNQVIGDDRITRGLESAVSRID